jgi:hypothetical protein
MYVHDSAECCKVRLSVLQNIDGAWVLPEGHGKEMWLNPQEVVDNALRPLGISDGCKVSSVVLIDWSGRASDVSLGDAGAYLLDTDGRVIAGGIVVGKYVRLPYEGSTAHRVVLVALSHS